ncbi:MAG: hypothetical protein C4334_03615 [Pyrinomonas sp.]
MVAIAIGALAGLPQRLLYERKLADVKSILVPVLSVRGRKHTTDEKGEPILISLCACVRA